MHNIKFIRQNPEIFDKAMAKRGIEPIADKILELDAQNRGSKTSLQELKQKSNELAKQIGMLKSQGKDAEDVISKSKQIKQQIASLKDDENQETPLNSELDKLLASLPNIIDDAVPVGKDEEDNIVIKTHGDIPKFDFEPKPHYQLGEDLGMMDFEQSAKISGSRFVILKDKLAKLERVLIQFMIDIHTDKFGYEEVSVPLLVKDEAMFGSGQLPKFAEDSFATTNNYRLIPTAEVPLVNMSCNSIIDKEKLPLRYVSCTPCFRSEAGSAGKDTRGMIRTHQFWKVELVSITDEQQAQTELDRKLECAEEILKQLEIPYRVTMLCTGDTGFCAKKTFDIEAWLPAQNKYREISSCSDCGDFQGRRTNTRYKIDKKNNKFVHSFNGSGLAIGRTMVAILENYQNKDGSIRIPKILQKYFDNDLINIKN